LGKTCFRRWPAERGFRVRPGAAGVLHVVKPVPELLFEVAKAAQERAFLLEDQVEGDAKDIVALVEPGDFFAVGVGLLDLVMFAQQGVEQVFDAAPVVHGGASNTAKPTNLRFGRKVSGTECGGRDPGGHVGPPFDRALCLVLGASLKRLGPTGTVVKGGNELKKTLVLGHQWAQQVEVGLGEFEFDVCEVRHGGCLGELRWMRRQRYVGAVTEDDELLDTTPKWVLDAEEGYLSGRLATLRVVATRYQVNRSTVGVWAKKRQWSARRRVVKQLAAKKMMQAIEDRAAQHQADVFDAVGNNVVGAGLRASLIVQGFMVHVHEEQKAHAADKKRTDVYIPPRIPRCYFDAIDRALELRPELREDAGYEDLGALLNPEVTDEDLEDELDDDLEDELDADEEPSEVGFHDPG
jgi:hypothetical protein